MRTSIVEAETTRVGGGGRGPPYLSNWTSERRATKMMDARIAV